MKRLIIMLGCIAACIASQDLYFTVPAEHLADPPATLAFALIVTKVNAAKVDLDKANVDVARQDETQARLEKKVKKSFDRAEVEQTTEAEVELADNHDALSMATVRAAAALLKKKGLEQRLEQEKSNAMNLLSTRCIEGPHEERNWARCPPVLEEELGEGIVGSQDRGDSEFEPKNAALAEAWKTDHLKLGEDQRPAAQEVVVLLRKLETKLSEENAHLLREMKQGAIQENKRKGKKTSPVTAAADGATTTPSNNAKCAGDMQNHDQMIGTLDCQSARGKQSKDDPKNCPDNLSNGKVWVCQANERGGRCLDLAGGKHNGTMAFSQRATVVPPGAYLKVRQACQGVVTKAAVAHPHKAGKDIGILALKRMKCNNDENPSCEVFKSAVCIKADKEMFANDSLWEEHATDTELRNFAKYVTANAWIDAGTANARVKANWTCDDYGKFGSATLAEGWIKAF